MFTRCEIGETANSKSDNIFEQFRQKSLFDVLRRASFKPSIEFEFFLTQLL